MVSEVTGSATMSEIRARRNLKKFFTSEEMDERRLKGLCEFCGKEFTPGHYSKHKKIQLYVMEIDEIPKAYDSETELFEAAMVEANPLPPEMDSPADLERSGPIDISEKVTVQSPVALRVNETDKDETPASDKGMVISLPPPFEGKSDLELRANLQLGVVRSPEAVWPLSSVLKVGDALELGAVVNQGVISLSFPFLIDFDFMKPPAKPPDKLSFGLSWNPAKRGRKAAASFLKEIDSQNRSATFADYVPATLGFHFNAPATYCCFQNDNFDNGSLFHLSDAKFLTGMDLRKGKIVAVKKFCISKSKKDEGLLDMKYHNFEAYDEKLGKIRNKDISRLWCCYDMDNRKLLVYQYMPKGSLGELLHSSKGCSLIGDFWNYCFDCYMRIMNFTEGLDTFELMLVASFKFVQQIYYREAMVNDFQHENIAEVIKEMFVEETHMKDAGHQLVIAINEDHNNGVLPARNTAGAIEKGIKLATESVKISELENNLEGTEELTHKFHVPGVKSGTQSASTMKAIFSAKKIRAITHSVVASEENFLGLELQLLSCYYLVVWAAARSYLLYFVYDRGRNWKRLPYLELQVTRALLKINGANSWTEVMHCNFGSDRGSTMFKDATAILVDMKKFYPLKDAAETVNEMGYSIQRVMGENSGILYNIFCKAVYAKLKTCSKPLTAKGWSDALEAFIAAVSKFGGASAVPMFPSMPALFIDYVSGSAHGSSNTQIHKDGTHHQRTSSASIVIDDHPSWLPAFIHEPETPIRKVSPRCSMADSKNGNESVPNKKAPAAGARYVINLTTFSKWLQTLYAHWNEFMNDYWGGSEALLVAAPPASAVLWRQIHFSCSQKKTSLLEDVKSSPKEVVDVDVVLHVVPNGDGATLMDFLIGHIYAFSKEGISVAGHIAKTTPDGKLFDARFGKPKDSFKLLAKYLATFSFEDMTAVSEAKDEVDEEIDELLKSPDMFQCDLGPAIKQLGDDVTQSVNGSNSGMLVQWVVAVWMRSMFTNLVDKVFRRREICYRESVWCRESINYWVNVYFESVFKLFGLGSTYAHLAIWVKYVKPSM